MSSDWCSDKHSVFVTLGASNHTEQEREGNDYYATDPMAIDALEGVLGGSIPHKIWEPACGEGHLSKRLKEFGHDVISTDLIDRGYGSVQDFLLSGTMPDGCECIITNPPYKYATEFVLHSLELLPVGGICAMFLKTTFLEGQKRYDKIFKDMPPKYVYQFVKRCLCAKNGEFQRMRDGGGSAMAYAWFVWEKGYSDEPKIKWL